LILSLAAPAVIVGLAIGGCGGGNDNNSSSKPSTTPATPASQTQGGTVTVSETDFKLNPANAKVSKAGPVTIQVTNNGKVEHSLEVEGNGVEQKLSKNLAPGESGSLKVTLKPGTYDWYCPVDGHRKLGMEGKLTVAGASSGGTSTSGSSSGSSGSGSGSSNSGSGGGGY
jgi:uncharacterized cupredoxin-like copper-binding protein